MKSKGFTLIELLSVIIIIAVITLIAVPIVSGVVTKVKLNALKSSAYGLLEASDLYYARYNNTKSLRFNIDDNNVSSSDTNNLLSYKGTIKEGTVIINKKGETTICITDGTNSVYKNYRDKKVVEAANKKCNIPSSTYIVYLDNEATLNELSNQELTELVRSMQEEMDEMRTELNSKASQSDLEIVSTVAESATLDKTYPIGSIYVSVSSTSPATLFGGSWERIQDKFLLASGSNYIAGNTGGSATNSHTHSVTASGTVNGHTLTVSEIPSHNHYLKIGPAAWNWTGGSNNEFASSYAYGTSNPHYYTNTTDGFYSAYAGGSGSHNHTFTGSTVISGTPSDTNNMPPYLSVYVWKRIA